MVCKKACVRTCGPFEDSDQSAHYIAQTEQHLHWVQFTYQRMKIFFLYTTKTLIRLRVRAGLFESSLGAHFQR